MFLSKFASWKHAHCNCVRKFSVVSPPQRLQLARHPRRPSTLDYIQAISDEWIELHGDRRSSDDLACGGVAGCWATSDARSSKAVT